MPKRSCDYALDDLAGDVGQPEVAALIVEGEVLMVHPRQVEQGRVQVADADRVLGDVVAEFVGFALAEARLHAAAGHPHAEVYRIDAPKTPSYRIR